LACREPGPIWRFLKDSLESGKAQGKQLKKEHKKKIRKKLGRDKNEKESN